ncbi:MAG: hypothetical protein EOS21_30065 [Mesorhizobium sp.]|nr:MAG: hypothetical protein EOS21_30065 [Mesorhizobium sp.]
MLIGGRSIRPDRISGHQSVPGELDDVLVNAECVSRSIRLDRPVVATNAPAHEIAFAILRAVYFFFLIFEMESTIWEQSGGIKMQFRLLVAGLASVSQPTITHAHEFAAATRPSFADVEPRLVYGLVGATIGSPKPASETEFRDSCASLRSRLNKFVTSRDAALLYWSFLRTFHSELSRYKDGAKCGRGAC